MMIGMFMDWVQLPLGCLLFWGVSTAFSPLQPREPQIANSLIEYERLN